MEDGVCSRCHLQTPGSYLRRREGSPPTCEACLGDSKDYALPEALYAMKVTVDDCPREEEPEIDCPVVSTQRRKDYRPGKRLYQVQYRLGKIEGVLSFSSREAVDRTIRATVQSGGGEILRVVELQDMLPEEYGESNEQMVVAEWSREEIYACSKASEFAALYGVSLKSVLWPQQEPARTDGYRRIKQVGVPRNHVLQFLSGWTYRYVAEGIPADAEVLEVHENHERREFLFTIRHDSFPVHQDGNCVERLNVTWRAV